MRYICLFLFIFISTELQSQDIPDNNFPDFEVQAFDTFKTEYGRIRIGSYYGFNNETIYRGITYAIPFPDWKVVRWFKIDLGYLEPLDELDSEGMEISNFYVFSAGLNLKRIVQKFFLGDPEKDLTLKAKSLLHINAQRTNWLIIEPGIFYAYDFNNNDWEAGIRIDLVGLTF